MKIISGFHGGNGNPEVDIPRYMNLKSSGVFDPSNQITETFDLQDINLAIKKIVNGGLAGRCIIKCR